MWCWISTSIKYDSERPFVCSAQVFDAVAQLCLIHLPRQICLICSPLRRAPDIQLPLKRTWPGWPRQHYLHTWETSVWCWPPARLLHLLSHHALCKLSLAEPESAGGYGGRRAEPRGVGGGSSNCLLKMPTEQDEAVWRIRPDWPRSSAACRLISGDRDTHKHAHALTTHTARHFKNYSAQSYDNNIDSDTQHFSWHKLLSVLRPQWQP